MNVESAIVDGNIAGIGPVGHHDRIAWQQVADGLA